MDILKQIGKGQSGIIYLARTKTEFVCVKEIVVVNAYHAHQLDLENSLINSFKSNFTVKFMFSIKNERPKRIYQVFELCPYGTLRAMVLERRKTYKPIPIVVCLKFLNSMSIN
jgi:serine/threonine protein kinase